MKNCEGCKHDGRLCLTCSRMYQDKWEPKESEMTAEEAEEYIYSSQVFSIMTAREKEAVLALIREAKKKCCAETETWNGMNKTITVPKGTFERIYNDDEDDADI